MLSGGRVSFWQQPTGICEATERALAARGAHGVLTPSASRHSRSSSCRRRG